MEDIIAAARSRRTRKQRQTRTKRYSHNSRIRQRTRFRVGTTTTTFAPISVDPVINDLEDPVILPDESVVPVLPLILLNDSSTTEHVPLSTQISVIVEISEVLNNKIQNPIENEQVDHVTPQLAESTTEKNSQEENTEVESTNIPILGDEPIKIDLELQEYGNSTEIQETTKEPIISNPINFTLPSITEKLEIVLKIENASVSEDLEATTVKLESVTTTERAQTTQSVIVSNEESSSEVKPYEPSSAEIDKILNLELIKQEYPDPGDYNKLPNHPTTFKVPINIQPDSKITPVKGPVIEKVVTTKAPDIIQESSGDYNKLPNSDITVAEESSDSSEEVNSLERDPEEPDEPEEPTDNDLISNTQMSQEDTKYGNNPGNSDYYFMLSNDQMEVFEEDEYFNE